MKSINQVILLGRAGRDARTTQGKGGWTRSVVSLVTSQNIRRGEEWEEKATWHNIVALARSEEKYGAARNLSQVEKGDVVLVMGRMETRQYDQDGVRKTIVEILASHVERLKPLRALSQQRVDTPGEFDRMDDDIPF